MVQKTYIRIVLGLALSLLGAVALANYIINPLGIYDPPVIQGINNLHPAAAQYVRILKRERVKRIKPDVIITGTSRAENGLNPTPDMFNGLTPYNFGLPSASIREQRAALEFADAVHPLKQAIITLDFFAFNGRRLENKQFDPEKMSPKSLTPLTALTDKYGYLVTLDVFIAALRTPHFLRHMERYGYPADNGFKVDNDMAWEIKKDGAAIRFIKPGNENETNISDFDFAYPGAGDKTTFDEFAAMLDFARLHNIDVIVLLSPLHVTYLDKIASEGKAETAEEWKHRIADIVRADGLSHHANPYPLWDFAYPNSITREALPPLDDRKTVLTWFWDSNHYKEATGNLVLQKILGLPGSDAHPDFGRRLN